MKEDSKSIENENEISKDDTKSNKLKKAKTELFNRLNTAENARIKRNISVFLQKYSKVTVYGIVIALMVIVCAVSLINRRNQVDDEGTMMSMTEIAAESKPFAGKSFNAEILTYDDMLQIEGENGNGELSDADQQRIDAILASVDVGGDGTTVYDKSQSITLNEREEVQVDTTQAQTVTVVQSTDETSSSSLVSAPVYATADGNYEYVGEFTLTAYCPCPICCGAWSNMENPTTASGTRATANRTVAVDTSVFPFGTEILINGQVYVAEDRGSAINGNHIDIFFSTHQEAVNFGKQKGSVYKKITN